MKDSAFSGMACFSSSVSPEIKLLWSENGGTIAYSTYERRHSQYYFCNGPNDPWLPELSIDNSRVVFHAEWVRTAVIQGFRVAMSTYVLDGRHDHFPYLKADETVTTPRRDTSLSVASRHSQTAPSDAPSAYVLKRHTSLFASNPIIPSPFKRSKSEHPASHSAQQPSPVSPICSRRHAQRPLTISPDAPTTYLPSKRPIKTRSYAVLLERPSEKSPHVGLKKESSGSRSNTGNGTMQAGPQTKPENSIIRSLPEDFWTSICLDACQIRIPHPTDVAVAIIPVNKVLESLSECAGRDLEMFRPGLVYKGKGFSCIERDRRKTV